MYFDQAVVECIDPGTLECQRTVITGLFQALLSDIPVTDSEERKFLGLEFESEALDVWHGTPTYKRDFDFESRIQTLDIKAAETSKFEAGGLGRVTVTRAARVAAKTRSSFVRSEAILKVEFEKPKSI